MSSVEYLCEDCNRLVPFTESDQKAAERFLCKLCYILKFGSKELREQTYNATIDRIIADMYFIQGYDCKERHGYYQIRSLLMELRKEQTGGYISVSYMEEKAGTLLSVAKGIAKEKGMYSYE